MLKNHIKIGNLYTMTEYWVFDKDEVIKENEIILILDIKEIDEMASDVSVLHNNKIHKRTYINTKHINNLKLVV